MQPIFFFNLHWRGDQSICCVYILTQPSSLLWRFICRNFLHWSGREWCTSTSCVQHTHTHTHTRTHTHTQTSVYTHTHKHLHTPTYTDTHTNTEMYIITHTMHQIKLHYSAHLTKFLFLKLSHILKTFTSTFLRHSYISNQIHNSALSIQKCSPWDKHGCKYEHGWLLLACTYKLSWWLARISTAALSTAWCFAAGYVACARECPTLIHIHPFLKRSWGSYTLCTFLLLCLWARKRLWQSVDVPTHSTALCGNFTTESAH